MTRLVTRFLLFAAGFLVGCFTILIVPAGMLAFEDMNWGEVVEQSIEHPEVVPLVMFFFLFVAAAEFIGKYAVFGLVFFFAAEFFLLQSMIPYVAVGIAGALVVVVDFKVSTPILTIIEVASGVAAGLILWLAAVFLPRQGSLRTAVRAAREVPPPATEPEEPVSSAPTLPQSAPQGARARMTVPPILRYLVLIPLAYVAACVAAGAIVGIAVRDHPLLPEGLPIHLAARLVGAYAAMPALLAVLVAEPLHFRSFGYWTGVGGAIGIAGLVAEAASPQPSFEGVRAALLVVAGLCGGAIYWLIAGRYSGVPKAGAE